MRYTDYDDRAAEIESLKGDIKSEFDRICKCNE